MGGNGGSGRGGCIQSGTFSGWRVQSANNGCTRRYFARGTTIPSWTAPEILDNYLNQRTRYDDIRQQVESTGHALVHTGIGGNNGDMSFMYSTNDPIFWLHHGFIDYIWWEWQQRHPSAANDYPSNPSNTRLATYNIPVSSTFDTRSSEYCYTYPRWTVNAPRIDASTPPSGALQAAGSPDSATTVNRAQSQGTSASNTPSTTASASESCPTGNADETMGCRKSRRALDVARLAPQVSRFPGFVGPDDRTTSNKIRVPDQVPDSYLQMNNISPAVALENYLQSAIIACKLNLLPNYKPLVNL
ncbi:Di-copper centre-containing protein [Conidiobolus coronatus NRRL 28638]|uniref:Di-copper centre-containing protein n=1 Tax=Conidiobolus coronatus (strain ATCC 28846 / CBS 209.66 / NRRL 28638) TaxID=796925 RepID=A0A137PC54_CONC2|nr:Di-copper centre-containing protein [Conidiobolus coronatus NRRL 28638]|eukprot:KXN72579.1 Di-copper centre-containing protein [Conidiobolus coronatus NRRL 28638]